MALKAAIGLSTWFFPALVSLALPERVMSACREISRITGVGGEAW